MECTATNWKCFTLTGEWLTRRSLAPARVRRLRVDAATDDDEAAAAAAAAADDAAADAATTDDDDALALWELCV